MISGYFEQTLDHINTLEDSDLAILLRLLTGGYSENVRRSWNISKGLLYSAVNPLEIGAKFGAHSEGSRCIYPCGFAFSIWNLSKGSGKGLGLGTGHYCRMAFRKCTTFSENKTNSADIYLKSPKIDAKFGSHSEAIKLKAVNFSRSIPIS